MSRLEKTGGGVMNASMTTAYGLRHRLRKAMILLCCASFISASQPKLLILGDSLTAGYGLAHADGFQAQLTLAFPNVTLIDAAVSGDTSAGGLARLDWALTDGADAAIVELGANDGLRGIDPQVTEANLNAILDQLAARHIPVLLTGMYALPNLGDDYQHDFRVVFDRLGQRPGLIYDPFFLEGVAGNPQLNQDDHLHPNPTGVKIITARLQPLVAQLLKMAARP